MDGAKAGLWDQRIPLPPTNLVLYHDYDGGHFHTADRVENDEAKTMRKIDDEPNAISPSAPNQTASHRSECVDLILTVIFSCQPIHRSLKFSAAIILEVIFSLAATGLMKQMSKMGQIALWEKCAQSAFRLDHG